MKAIGLVNIVVGGQNQGKTKYILDKLKSSKRKIFVYDHRREYMERLPRSVHKRLYVFYSLSYFKKFLPHFNNANVVVEEPIIFMNSMPEEKFIDIVSGSYHRGNTLYFPFQIMRKVPLYLLDLCNYVVFYPTGEDVSHLKTSRPKYYEEIMNCRKFPLIIPNQPLTS